MNGCRDCDNTLEPYATDGGDFYRTGDRAGRCATCNSSAVCVCCDERFPCADPSDPDNVTCPGCAAETGRFIAAQRETNPQYGKDV